MGEPQSPGPTSGKGGLSDSMADSKDGGPSESVVNSRGRETKRFI